MARLPRLPRVPRPNRRVVGALAVGAVAALLAGIAVVAPGFDAQRTPVDAGTVWALQNGDSLRYARINVELGELETVKRVADPEVLAQSPDGLMVTAAGRFARVDLARPVDLDAESPAFVDAPSGAADPVSAGGYVAFRAGDGTVSLTTVAGEADAEPTVIRRPVDGADPEPWTVDALAIDAVGRLVGWTAETSTIAVYDAPTATFVRQQQVGDAAGGRDPQVTLVAGRWALLRGSELLLEGRSDPVEVRDGLTLQSPSLAGDDVLLADSEGVVRVTRDGRAEDAVAAPGGTAVSAAVITEVDGVRWAAWIGTGEGGGTAWRADTGASIELPFGGDELESRPTPVIQVNGRRAIVNDVASGWVWTLPDGDLVESSQNWNLGETESTEDTDQVEAVVVDPKPPVALADSFGVRAGAVVTLPVLLNDSDPNGDPISIVPTSLAGLPASFGSVATARDDQVVVVTVAPGARGTATFTYRVEDASRESRDATVTLEVVPDSVNSAPQFCTEIVAGCTTTAPTPEVPLGGAVDFDWLRGWVDPEGDPIFVSTVTVEPGDPAVAAAQDAGRVVLRHTDPNATGGGVTLALQVSDVRGAAQPATQLRVPVSASPAIRAESFSVAAEVGVPLRVAPLDRVTGGAGPLHLAPDVRQISGPEAALAVNAVTGEFEVSAPEAGSYVFEWTVGDGTREKKARTRVTAREVADSTISMAPLVAFVRAQEDTTLAILPAVSNPGGRVLLVSDAEASATAGGQLFASVVGREFLRVSGATAGLEAGLIGSVAVRVTDGVSQTIGSVAVYLLPALAPAAPIAVDDAIVVRAGERADVDVLANDLAPRGSAFAFDGAAFLDQDPDAPDTATGFAFATDRVVRLVAPREPGEYEVRYTLYTVGAPTLRAVGSLRVTVTGGSDNADPIAPTLVGRVVAGESVAIPFSSAGVDPDGDEVVLDAVSDDPEAGIARVSADGRSLVYTAIVGGPAEVTFGYRIRDARGGTAEGRVRVGVLAQGGDSAPIAYSDYIQVEAGAGARVVIQPLANDLDPSGSGIQLVGSPRPNVSVDPAFDAERADLERRISLPQADVVEFDADVAPGTYSYFYDVANGFGETSVGVLVIRVVAAAVPTAPVVADTVLTAVTRADFAAGVDVVSGKVTWAGGDIGALRLRLPQGVTGVEASGSRLRGTLPDARRVIPFLLEGEAFDGTPVQGFGFLVVPGPLDLPPTLAIGTTATEVKERESASLDVARLIDLPSGARLEVQASGVRATGQRAGASCSSSGGSSVSYVASENPPWRDYCIVPARFEGQEVWTALAVPVTVIPGDPQPELRAAAVTVSPGEVVTFDLAGVTSWLGPAQSDAAYTISDDGAPLFDVPAPVDGKLSIEALSDARPGSRVTLSVGISNYDDVLPAALSLTVGPAPATLPRGGSASQACQVTQSGNQCVISVIGAPGEINPLPKVPLKLVAVEPPSCPGMEFRVASASTIVASWTPETPGGVCSAPFTVTDAQGRPSAGDRQGILTVDFAGYPARAASVEQVGFADGSVRLAVRPGGATASSPPVTKFEIRAGSRKVVECDVDGSCPAITGLTNGDKIEYAAYAVNEQGASLEAPVVTAWSYRPPPAPASATWVPTAPTGGAALGWAGLKVDLVVDGVSADTETLEIRVGGSVKREAPVGGATTVSIDAVDIGANSPLTVTILPVSNIEVPDGTSRAGTTLAVPGVFGVGSPTGVSLTTAPVGSDSMRLTAAAAAPTAPGVTLEYAFGRTPPGGTAPACDSLTWGAASTVTLAVPVAERNQPITYLACVRFVFGGTSYGVATASAEGFAFEAPSEPTGVTGYGISTTASDASQAGGTIAWTTLTAPTVPDPADAKFQTVYFLGAAASATFQLPPATAAELGPAPAVAVRYCLQSRSLTQVAADPSASCSPATTIPVLAGAFDRALTVPVVTACPASETDKPLASGAASWASASTGTIDGRNYVYDVTVDPTGTGTPTGVVRLTYVDCVPLPPSPSPTPTPTS